MEREVPEYFSDIVWGTEMGILYLNNMKTELIDLQLIVCCIPEVRLDVFIIVRLTDGLHPGPSSASRDGATSSLSTVLSAKLVLKKIVCHE